jgi:hypothetical protein
MHNREGGLQGILRDDLQCHARLPVHGEADRCGWRSGLGQRYVGDAYRGTMARCTPTGNVLHFDVVDMFRVEDGRVAEHWDVADTLGLFSQLGKVKVP